MRGLKKFQWFPWNGSKRWIVEHLVPVFRTWHGGGRYIEPFVGGGSVAAAVAGLFDSDQYLSDANPWLVAAFRSQIGGCGVAENYADVDYWRGLTDKDLPNLTVAEAANRFAVCLFTAWGNRWETRPDGKFRSTVNPRYCDPVYLRSRLDLFFSVRWLRPNDSVSCADWTGGAGLAAAGDLVYLDPPYPESLGYGNQWWSFSDQLDVVDWVADAVKRDVSVVVSNMFTVERLYRRAGLKTFRVVGPKSSKTRRDREEVIAWAVK